MRKFKSGNYPVAARRPLLEAGTEWTSFTGVRVRLTAVRPDQGMVCFSRDRGTNRIPYAAWLSATSFLRNYKREDEA